ncbi:MAG TPA: metallophosphoesterase [Chryseosolibacter sp.]|jgi:predicted phosphodiesterase|nr:metallophosphoesterase [Chryseosolibacter sp.]
MRSFIRLILYKPIIWLVNRYSSAPDHARVFAALSKLKKTIDKAGTRKGLALDFNSKTDRFIIFSDQHKGRKNGADDFAPCEKNYLEALRYYDERGFHFISLGDCEELWENTMLQVMKANRVSFEAEKRFVRRNAFTKIFGNHDLDWNIDPLMLAYLKKMYDASVPVFEGIVMRTHIGKHVLKIFCTHGHQGDLQSDGNWFSKFFVAKIWAPLQAYLRINPNTPAYDKQLKTAHNRMMFEWAMQQTGLMLITGHTHQPVFESLTHFERLQWQHRKALYEQNPEWAQAIEDEMKWRSAEDTGIAEDYLHIRPVYFNTGCCCFADGDITGLEIADEFIRLVKWKQKDQQADRIVLEERRLDALVKELWDVERTKRRAAT